MNCPAHFSDAARRSADAPISWLMKLKLDRRHLISLAAGFTDDATLPTAEIEELTRHILRHPRTGRAALQYGSTAGLPSLRAILANRCIQQDQLPMTGPSRITPESVIVTNGSQQLLYLVTEALCDTGDIVLVEDPTYFVYLGIIETKGLRAFGFDTPEKLADRLEHLRRQRLLGRLKLLYLVSYYRNPTGHTWSWEAKQEAFDIVAHYERHAGHPLYILEDAAYRDLRFEGDDTPSFLTLDRRHRRVIYANTLTKPFATGMKTGYGILPLSLHRVVSRFKGHHDFGTANFLQTILARALTEGIYDRHLPRIAAAYRRKRDVMVRALRLQATAFPVAFSVPTGGLYLWLKLPKSTSTGVRSSLFKSALDAGVLYVPGELCFCADPTRPIPRHFIRLSFGSPTSKQISIGIDRLSRAFVSKSRSNRR